MAMGGRQCDLSQSSVTAPQVFCVAMGSRQCDLSQSSVTAPQVSCVAMGGRQYADPVMAGCNDLAGSRDVFAVHRGKWGGAASPCCP